MKKKDIIGWWKERSSPLRFGLISLFIITALNLFGMVCINLVAGFDALGCYLFFIPSMILELPFMHTHIGGSWFFILSEVLSFVVGFLLGWLYDKLLD